MKTDNLSPFNVDCQALIPPSPSPGVLPSQACSIGRVAAVPLAPVAQFARLVNLSHDSREDGGHRQGVSCTDKADDENKLTSPHWPLPLPTIPSLMHSRGGWTHRA